MARDKITNHREAVNIVTCPVMRSLLVLGRQVEAVASLSAGL